jgi:hypothetical protein
MMWRRVKTILVNVMTLTVILIAVACCRSTQLYEVLVVHGPAGRPLVFGCSRGVLYFATSDVPVWTFESQWIHEERWPASGIDFLINDSVCASDWQAGYRIQTVPYSYAEPKAYGFSLAKGSDALHVPNTWWILGSAPAWFVGPLLAIYPLRRSFFWWRSRRRRLRGLCPVCAYDLRESPERCPECGRENGAGTA